MTATAPSIGAIHPGALKEAAALVAAQPLFERYGATTESLVRAWRTGIESGDHVMAAVELGAVVGVAWLVPQGAFARSPYLRLLAVTPVVAGRGVGTALLRACEAWAFERADDLFLLVNDDNVAARRFYERRAFEVIGRVHDYVLPGFDETIMRKRRPSPTDRAHGATSTCPPRRPA